MCEALASGRQTLVLRKGGLLEGPDGFQVEHPEFWLLPTRFHQQADELQPDATPLLSRLSPPPVGELPIELYARVEAVRYVERASDLAPLVSQQVLSEGAVLDRFHYRRPGLSALWLRVYRLPERRLIADLPEYAGCHSWVPLAKPLATIGLQPVLEDASFLRRLAAVLR